MRSKWAAMRVRVEDHKHPRHHHPNLRRQSGSPIPNADVYLSPVILNQTAYPIRRFDVIVGIHYNDDLPKAVRIARETLSGDRWSP